jgi:hypothetical protein
VKTMAKTLMVKKTAAKTLVLPPYLFSLLCVLVAMEFYLGIPSI